jgi:hypothetical protein
MRNSEEQTPAREKTENKKNRRNRRRRENKTVSEADN